MVYVRLDLINMPISHFHPINFMKKIKVMSLKQLPSILQSEACREQVCNQSDAILIWCKPAFSDYFLIKTELKDEYILRLEVIYLI